MFKVKKSGIYIIPTVFSFALLFGGMNAYALTDAEYTYIKTYEAVTGLDMTDVPTTAYGISYYDYATKQGVNFGSVKPSGVDDSIYGSWLDGLDTNFINDYIVDYIAMNTTRQYTGVLDGVVRDFYGIGSDSGFIGSLWDTLLNNHGYNGGVDGSPTYTIKWDGGEISCQFVGYSDRSNLSSWQIFGTQALPSPFLGYAAGGGYGSNYYKFIPLSDTGASSTKFPVFTGTSGGVTVYAEAGTAIYNGYLSGFRVVDSNYIRPNGGRAVRCMTYFTTPQGVEISSVYFDVDVGSVSSQRPPEISYEGIDLNLIGYWLKPSSGGSGEWQEITPSEMIVNDWQMENGGYINIASGSDAGHYEVCVDFDSDPVQSAGIKYSDNYPVMFTDPYIFDYDKPYDSITDVVKDSSKNRDTWLKKISNTFVQVKLDISNLLAWLKNLVEMLRNLIEQLFAVPDYTIFNTDFFGGFGGKVRDFINIFNNDIVTS